MNDRIRLRIDHRELPPAVLTALALPPAVLTVLTLLPLAANAQAPAPAPAPASFTAEQAACDRAERFATAIEHWLEHIDVEGRLNLAALHDWLAAEHSYPGSLRSLQRYFRTHYPRPRIRARAAADPPVPELVGATLFMIATALLVLWPAGRIFRIGILRTGNRPKLAELVQWVRGRRRRVNKELSWTPDVATPRRAKRSAAGHR